MSAAPPLALPAKATASAPAGAAPSARETGLSRTCFGSKAGRPWARHPGRSSNFRGVLPPPAAALLTTVAALALLLLTPTAGAVARWQHSVPARLLLPCRLCPFACSVSCLHAQLPLIHVCLYMLVPFVCACPYLWSLNAPQPTLPKPSTAQQSATASHALACPNQYAHTASANCPFFSSALLGGTAPPL